MANYSWKDIADITFAATDLKAFVKGVTGVKLNAVMQEFHPAGSVFPAPVDSALRNADPINVEFIYDGGASGPAVKCAIGTSSTLTITFATGQSITGTFIVSSVEVVLSSEGDHMLNVEFTPSGTITLDVTA